MTKPGPARPSLPDGFGYANPFFVWAACFATLAGYGQHRRWSVADVTTDHRDALREAYAGKFKGDTPGRSPCSCSSQPCAECRRWGYQ